MAVKRTGRNRAQTKENMAGWMTTSLVKAQRYNRNVGFSSAKDAAYIKCHRNSRKNISKSMQGVQLYWGLSGCMPGKQHFRLCTPHALAKEEDLHCRQCCWLRQYVQGQDSVIMPGSEKLVAEAFYSLNMTSGVCHQVAVNWWGGLIDFFHIERRAYIQADGPYHDTGMHELTRDQVLDLNMEFCVAAVKACLPLGVSAARIRTAERSVTSCIADTLDIISDGPAVVLSPTFADVIVSTHGSAGCPFPLALWYRLPECIYQVSAGCHVFSRCS